MYHSFLSHSSADGHLGCFRVLAIVNSAAVNAGVHVSVRIVVFSGYVPNNGIAGSYGSFLVFKEISILFSIVSDFISLHSHEQYKRVPFLSSFCLAFIVCRFFDHGHSDRYEVKPHCSFDLHFSNK